jgi:hypothetical protein
MSRQNRVRKLINLDIKKEIISKRESGKSLGDLSAEYGMAKSTISTILIYFYWGKFGYIFTGGILFMLFMCVRFFMLLLWKVRL